ncbi:NAC domain-containing protein 77, partial [Linum perenne]
HQPLTQNDDTENFINLIFVNMGGMTMVMKPDHGAAKNMHSISSPAAKIVAPECLPVGYRFKPTEVELAKYYLMEKAFNPASPLPAFIGVDIEASEFCTMAPSDLVPNFRQEEREWFFFVHLGSDQDLKGKMVKRAVKNGRGNWILVSKEVICDSTGVPLAYKSELMYFLASTSSSHQRKTHWKLEEYRLHTSLNLRGQQWLLARLKRGTDYQRNYFID